MVRKFLILLFVVGLNTLLFSQNDLFDTKYGSTAMALLPVNDSLTVYQCHVEQATQTTITQSGQVLEGQKQNYTISEKYVITRNAEGYTLNYYTTALTVFPNRKFSGLKKTERKYWQFKLEKQCGLNKHDVLVFAAAEKLGKETTEYDFAITQYTTNQVIFKSKKLMRQLVLDTPTTIHQSLQCFK